ncbi:MAG: hypothetical protein QXK07_07025 [Desulfurococcaceae archaeon]
MLEASIIYERTLIDSVAFTVFLVDSALSITPREDIIDVIVVDKWTGMSVRASKYQPIPADERYLVFVISRQGNTGRIEIYDGGLLVHDTGYHRLVQVRIKKKFTSIDQMFDYVFSNSYMPVFIAREFLRESEVRSKKELIPALMPYYVSKNVSPGYIGSTADTENLEITDEMVMFFGWFNWDEFATKLVSGLAITGCLIGAGVWSIKTFGAGAPLAVVLAKGCLSGTLAGAGIGLGISVVRSFFVENTTPAPTPPPPPPPPPPPETINQYKEKFNESKRALEELLKLWRDQNRITQAEYETAIEHLSTMKEMYESTIKDMQDYAETIYKDAWNKGYQEGYNRGRDEERKKMIPYLATSGAVGLVIGVMIGRR